MFNVHVSMVIAVVLHFSCRLQLRCQHCYQNSAVGKICYFKIVWKWLVPGCLMADYEWSLVRLQSQCRPLLHTVNSSCLVSWLICIYCLGCFPLTMISVQQILML